MRIQDNTNSPPLVGQAFLGCEGRLTLATGVPVTTTDQTAKTVVYLAPYRGSRIALFDGTRWLMYYQYTEVSVAVPATTNTPFDVFAYDNNGTLTLETANWTNTTTRATALTTQNGIYVKSGALTRLYLGTGCTTGVSGQCEDSLANRLLWNNYNRQRRPLKKNEATNSWTYVTATWRSANNSAANRVTVVVGLSEPLLDLNVMVGMGVSGSGIGGAAGIAVDATNANNCDQSLAPLLGDATVNTLLMGHLAQYPLGYHYYQWTEYASAATVTFYSTAAGIRSGGLYGVLDG